MKSINELQFGGHETFVLKRLWLTKIIRYITEYSEIGFQTENAMICLGLGKNMVASARFWATAAGFLEKKTNTPTDLGNLIIGDGQTQGLDRHCEHPSTQWLVHWNLAHVPTALGIFWFLFNHVNKSALTRHDLYNLYVEFLKRNDLKFSDKTVRRDVEIVLRSYVPSVNGRKSNSVEEYVEPLLADLSILEPISEDAFLIKRTDRKTINLALFTYCLIDYWETLDDQSSSLDFQKIAYNLGSPGKVLKIDENSILSRLERLEGFTNGQLIWTEQAGLRTLRRSGDALSNTELFKTEMLRAAYQNE